MKTLAERFHEKYIPVPEVGCWLWTAASLIGGYGNFGIPKKQNELAHRFSWKLHRGPIPAGMNVCHKCDTPACVNPDHLFLGTQRDNIRDMIAKGRKVPPSATGEDHHSARLTNAQAQQVFDDSRRAREIAADFGISTSLVSHIKTGYSYPSVSRG